MVQLKVTTTTLRRGFTRALQHRLSVEKNTHAVPRGRIINSER